MTDCVTTARFCRKCGGSLPEVIVGPVLPTSSENQGDTPVRVASAAIVPPTLPTRPTPSKAHKVGIGIVSLAASYFVCGLILGLLFSLVGKTTPIGIGLSLLWLIVIPAVAVIGYRWWMRTRYGGGAVS